MSVETTRERKTEPFAPTGKLTGVRQWESELASNMLDSSKQYHHLNIQFVFDDDTRTTLSESWEIDDGSSWLPVEVVNWGNAEEQPSENIDPIEKRIESYLLNTSREKKRGVLDWWKANIDLVDAVWMRSEAERHRKRSEEHARKSEDHARTAMSLQADSDELFASIDPDGKPEGGEL